MPDKSEIEKLRVLHDLDTLFDVPDSTKDILGSQLSNDNQGQIERFVSGFRIADWFEWIFSSMPWVVLIHGLDQQQFPSCSKEAYQVPDFLMLLETSAHTHRPLLVEVKSVSKQKQTLKIQDSQIAICKDYATALNIPLVYAIYWEKFCSWTLNTPDMFEPKSSCFKLPMVTAFETDCSLIVGDLSYLIPESLTRVSHYSGNTTSSVLARHEEYGCLVSDALILDKNRIELTCVESGAIDSMIAMKDRGVNHWNNNVDVKFTKTPDSNYMLKLSSWITRHLAIFHTTPTEETARLSAHVIVNLMSRLGCSPCHVFPSGRSDELKQLEELFITK